jgi:predicted SnoaL-like aldol condensation-catalyzing enzyme
MTANHDEQANKALVLDVVTSVFIKRDATILERSFGENYIQHNPAVPNGRDAVRGLIAGLGADFKYEPGMMSASGDIVMIHGRYTGWAPKPVVAVDIFRVSGGKVVEHWDVMQEEIPAAQTKNGNAMFETA